MGWHASDTHELVFDGCRVPEDHVLGVRGEGFKTFLRILDDGRIAIAALALGMASACLDASVAYAKERQAFGGPIGRYQSIAFKCADMAVAVENARNLVYKAAWLREQGRPIREAAAMAKLYATEIAVDATRDAVQIHGGYGYIDETPGESLLPRRQDPRDRRGNERDPAPRPRPGLGTSCGVSAPREARVKTPEGVRNSRAPVTTLLRRVLLALVRVFLSSSLRDRARRGRRADRGRSSSPPRRTARREFAKSHDDHDSRRHPHAGEAGRTRELSADRLRRAARRRDARRRRRPTAPARTSAAADAPT